MFFDTDPPEKAQAEVANFGLVRPIGYDPTSANAVGRSMQVRLSKNW